MYATLTLLTLPPIIGASIASRLRFPRGRRSPTIAPRPLAELHAHTIFSDGLLTPEELVEHADKAGLAALAITDHDIVGGVEAARGAARERAIEIVPGVECSTNLDNHEIHLLGLFIDDRDDGIIRITERAREFRRQRAAEIVERLQELGLEIEFDAVETAAGGGSIGRPHIAAVLVRAGASKSVDAAFRSYIGIGQPAYVPKPTVPVAEVIDVVHGAGAVAILAHPGSSRISAESIRELADLGLDGFEVRHPKHSSQQEAKLRALARELDLLPSGGSDFHGPRGGRAPIGSRAVSLEWMEALRAAAERHRHTSPSQKEAT